MKFKSTLFSFKHQQPNQGSIVYSVVNAMVDEHVDLIVFNQIVHGKEKDILNDFSFVIQQYLLKREKYGLSQLDLLNARNLNDKLKLMLNQISAQFPQNFDECFVRLYISDSWKSFLDEIFVEKASACYKKNWSDQNTFSKIVENILSKLSQTDYNGENDCSRVLQIFWDSLDLDLKYKIAIAYYGIYDDNVYRQSRFLQKQFAAKIYEELGVENVVKEMIKPDLKSSSANIEAIAKKYRLKREWVKEQYDELHQAINLDLDDFARI